MGTSPANSLPEPAKTIRVARTNILKQLFVSMAWLIITASDPEAIFNLFTEADHPLPFGALISFDTGFSRSRRIE
jgi:hypothetical protein